MQIKEALHAADAVRAVRVVLRGELLLREPRVPGNEPDLFHAGAEAAEGSKSATLALVHPGNDGMGLPTGLN
eukprot:7808080-Alexandrium_andersonii.AAC.1